MSNKDSRLIDAVIKMHEAAGAVYKDLGNGKLSDDIRKCADRLNDLLKATMHTGK